MRRPKPIPDESYRIELDRLRILPKFPELPAVQQEMIRAMRHITTTDSAFLHDVITHFVDNSLRCPTPHELFEYVGNLRHRASKPLGSPSCLKCGGTGWVHYSRTVEVAGLEPYEAEYARRCDCVPADRMSKCAI